MSCCRKNSGSFYSRPYENNCNENCGCENNCNESADLGISCPYQNNNDYMCKDSLKDAARCLTNQRVIIHVNGCKMCVVIVSVGDCFIKTVNPCTQKIVYFNLNRVDNIEDVLPRCY